MNTELIHSISIANLLQHRDAILERFAQMQTLAAEITQLTETIPDSFPPRFTWESAGFRHSLTPLDRTEQQHEMERYRKAIDRIFWKYLMEQSGNLALMDSKAKEEWREGLKREDVPELTLDTIAATFGSMHAARQEMFERGVINVFRRLSWDKKTNTPFKLGQKIIVSRVGGWSIYSGGSEIDDLMRCFCVLDGKPEPEYRHCTDNRIREAQHAGKDMIENDYMRLKVYRNRNAHVTFKRPDLVKQLNAIIARHFPFHIPQDNKTT